MTNQVFNIAKAAFAEKFRDGAANGEVVLLKVVEADAALLDHNELAALLAAANTEAVFTNYARKTGITGTITVDDTNERVDVDMPDQTWVAAGNGANDTLVKLLVTYNEGAGDANKIPLTHHDFSVTTDGSDVTAQFNASGFARAQN